MMTWRPWHCSDCFCFKQQEVSIIFSLRHRRKDCTGEVKDFSSWVVDVGIHYRDTYFQVSEDIWRKQQLFVRRARVIEQKAHIEQRASLSNGSEISDRTRANHPHHQMLMTEGRRASQKLTKRRGKIIIWLPPTSTRTILSSGSHLKIPQATRDRQIANYNSERRRNRGNERARSYLRLSLTSDSDRANQWSISSVQVRSTLMLHRAHCSNALD